MSLATPTKGKMCGLIFGEERLLLQIEVIMLFQHKKQYLILVLTDGRYPVAGLSPNGMVMDHILQKDVIIIPWGVLPSVHTQVMKLSGLHHLYIRPIRQLDTFVVTKGMILAIEVGIEREEC